MIPYRGNDDWVEKTIFDIYKYLNSEEIPEVNSDCDYCNYVISVAQASKTSEVQMNNQKIRAHIFISGRVQGVSFRQFTKEKAQELELVGWTRNLSDGRVEVLIEGDKEKIDKFLSHLKQGPSLSKVEKIEVNYQKHQGEFKTFEIIK